MKFIVTNIYKVCEAIEVEAADKYDALAIAAHKDGPEVDRWLFDVTCEPALVAGD